MMKTKRGVPVLLALFLFSGASLLEAQSSPPPLALGKGDVLIEARTDGYHLFIRQGPGAASVLLSEAFELPDHKLATYAFRPVGPNPVNDNEKRVLDGKPLKQPFLVSSTVIDHPLLGKAFQVVIPKQVEYGYQDYPNSRYGKIDVQASVSPSAPPFWFSVRVFAKPYADYSGVYRETAFELRAILQQKYVPSQNLYEQDLVDGFSRLGQGYPALNIDDAIAHVGKVLDRSGESLELVLIVDTTKSMAENLKTLQAKILAPLREEVKKFKTFRIGLVFYRDYMEDYLTRSVAFTSDFDQVQRDLNAASADGGGDIPEAVVEGLWAGLNNYNWLAENRVIVVMGDAPQHPTPRGSITETMVREKADEKKVEVQMIMLPQTAF